MNFQLYLEDTYRIIKEEPLILILGGLIVQLLTIVSLGILAGPFLGGYTLLVILYLRENKKPAFNDIFSGLQQFTHLFPYFIVLLFIFLGFTLLVIPGLIFLTWWIYVLPIMVDRKMPFMEAMRLSMNTVNEKGFLMHFVFVLLIYVIPLILIEFLTAIIPFSQVLKIILPPFQVGCLAGLYIDQFPVPVIEADYDAEDEIPVKKDLEKQSSPNVDTVSDDQEISAASNTEEPISEEAPPGEETPQEDAAKPEQTPEGSNQDSDKVDKDTI